MLRFKVSIPKYNDRKSYVKTIVCDVLGYDENNMYNQLIGDFYDCYLREKVLPIAIEEYQITPMLEMLLLKMNVEEQKVLGNNMLVYIQNIVANYSNNDYESAALMFAHMNYYLRKLMNNVGILAIDKNIGEFSEHHERNIVRR